MDDVTANLETEVRRLRVRIIGLSPTQLAEAGARSTATRRAVIAEALTELSRIGSDGRPVPDLSDQSLADQVVVLIDTGMRAAAHLPPEPGRQMLDRLHATAVELRRNLA